MPGGSGRGQTVALRSALAAALCVGFGVPLQAQGDEERRVIAVNVIDSEGAQVRGLTAASFRGEFRGEPIKIRSAEWDASQRRIAIVVDTSASVGRGTQAWTLAWAAAEDLVNSLTPDHRIALLTLGKTLQLHSDLSSDQQALQRALLDTKAREPGGLTFLFNGVVLASWQLFDGRGLGDVVYLISDGYDTSVLTNPGDAVIAVTRAGVRVFVVRVSNTSQLGSLAFSLRPGTPGFSLIWTARMAEATGGLVFWPEDYRKDAIEELRWFYPLITQIYRLEVAFPRKVDKPREWKLEVLDPNGRKLKNAWLVYPHLVVPKSRD